MQIREKEIILKRLIEHNYPFVLFKAPGKDIEFVVQRSAITKENTLKIAEKGFYVFPFTKREKNQAIRIRPDFICKWREFQDLNFQMEYQPILVQFSQDLNEVSKEEYYTDLQNYLNAFEEREIRKSIYARIKKSALPEKFSMLGFFEDISAKYPKAFCYLLHLPGHGIWTGASPELLLSYNQQNAKTVALAGTIKNDGSYPAPNWTRKEIDEHRMVELHIKGVCDELKIDYDKSEVKTINAGKVYHLKSDFNMNIPPDSITNFLERLHPTPAISGLPQEEAIELIYEIEPIDRSYYCGYLGWIESAEHFDLYINLRCMKIEDKNTFLFAGGGITMDSTIEDEWVETEMKMTTLSDLLRKDISFML